MRFGRKGSSNPQFDQEAPGSRFTMRPAFAVQVGSEWRERSEHERGVARRAISAEFGDAWLSNDPDLGEIRILDGVRGRGAAGWIPVLEWVGMHSAGGVVSYGAGQAAKRIWAKLCEAKSRGHRVMISRGLAALLAIRHVMQESSELEVLTAEFVREPSSVAGRPVSETSYTGFEVWIVSLVNESQTTRYLLAISPEGDVEGCIPVPMGEFEAMFSPPPQPNSPDA